MREATYKNKRTQQNQYFINNFKNIIDEIKPKRIIEIGTGFGNTTLLISDILHELNLKETIIKTFDVREKGNSENLKQVDNIIVYIGNIFNYRAKILTKPNEITEFLSKEDVNLILCDGGLKKVEFEILSQYMKKGDIIMAHDYAPNKEIFEKDYKDKIWNHMEITDKDIEKSVEKYNLKSYRMDIIKETAWVAKIKE